MKAYWGFFALKNPTVSAGFEPSILGTRGQHASSRPPKPLRAKGTSHEDQYAYFSITHSFPCRTKNVSDKSCTENQNTHFVFNGFLPKIVPFMK
jgi:hypothetical protein